MNPQMAVCSERIRKHLVFMRSELPLSKSYLNRALILASVFDWVTIPEFAESALSEDALVMAKALKDLAQGTRVIDVGASGTAYRFLASYCTLNSGSYRISGKDRVLKRSIGPLIDSLKSFGVEFQLTDSALLIQSSGWQTDFGSQKMPIEADLESSSQIGSSLLLTAAQLAVQQNRDVYLNFKNAVASKGYLELTIELLKEVGFQIEVKNSEIPFSLELKMSLLKRTPVILKPEVDVSAVFSLAALVAARPGSTLRILDGLHCESKSSYQPDIQGLKILKAAGAEVDFEGRDFFVKAPQRLQFNDLKIQDAPDLFPCLASLMSLSKSRVTLIGGKNLKDKESDRIDAMVSLLKSVGAECEALPDGIAVTPRDKLATAKTLRVETRRDHRIAFAAAVLANGNKGLRLILDSPEVVSKSHSQFWEQICFDLTNKPAKVKVIIGHRGSGKSSLARAIQKALAQDQELSVFDLDEELQRKNVSFDFSTEASEAKFRAHERDTFFEILASRLGQNLLISVGGGFDPSLIPTSCERIWIRRASDLEPRYFLNRPRLNPNLTEEEEWQIRSRMREIKFTEFSDRQIEIPEGLLRNPDQTFSTYLKSLNWIFKPSSIHVGGTVSIVGNNQLASQIAELKRFRPSFIELRTDLLTESEIEWVKEELPHCKTILAIRSDFQSTDLKADWVDVPISKKHLAKKLSSEKKSVILSIHQSDAAILGFLDLETIAQHLEIQNLIDKFSAELSPSFIKVALPIASFKLLKVWHEWAEAKQNRIFLPMQADTQIDWKWYRLLQAKRASVKDLCRFWHAGYPTATGQPGLIEWLQFTSTQTGDSFAAILGDPVLLSQTPAEQAQFFARFGMSVLRVQIPLTEADEAWPLLDQLGLKAAAVTSPLKSKIAEILRQTEAINTIVKKESWLATSTDAAGFEALWSEVKEELKTDVLIVGSGGVLPAIKKVVPQAQVISARALLTCQEAINVQTVIWAAGNQLAVAEAASLRLKGARLIVDLSYNETSIAVKLASRLKVQYQSGLTMFTRQAEAQREFWSKHLVTTEPNKD